jgi:hypothetical protein
VHTRSYRAPGHCTVNKHCSVSSTRGQRAPARSQADAQACRCRADWKDSAIAWGVYNGASMFRVRVLQLDREVRARPGLALDVPALLAARLAAAAALRAALGVPRAGVTDAYRLVNSEGDGLSGALPAVLCCGCRALRQAQARRFRCGQSDNAMLARCLCS